MNFIPVTYSSASQSTYSFGPTAMTRRVLWTSSVLLSEGFLGISSLVFSGTQHGVRGSYGVMTAGFFEK